jgi:DNA-binding NarL/FixJ family response regulator
MNSTIGLIDKDIITRLGIGVIIAKNYGSEILEADDFQSYMELYPNKNPDIIILGNYNSPQEGFETTQKLRRLFPNLPIVVYDENESSDLALIYLKLGVSAYLKKNALPGELLSCLQGVMMGKKYVSQDMLQNLLSSLRGKANRSETFPALTGRESQIADMLCKGMRTKNIAHSLGRKPSTISTIKYTIFKKLHVNNILELSNVLGHQNHVNISSHNTNSLTS